jgi:hypothetical protein
MSVGKGSRKTEEIAKRSILTLDSKVLAPTPRITKLHGIKAVLNLLVQGNPRYPEVFRMN